MNEIENLIPDADGKVTFTIELDTDIAEWLLSMPNYNDFVEGLIRNYLIEEDIMFPIHLDKNLTKSPE